MKRVCPRCSLETEAELCPDDGAETISVAVEAPTFPAGTLIAGRYRVDEVIGIGGFGAVYRCNQLNMDQTVAVKVLKSEHLKSLEHVKRFTREARAASMLKHPNTIRIFDFGKHEDRDLYLAMEYLEGETLAARLEQALTLPAPVLVHIMVQICHSLTEAHGAKLIHRDLKPENIVLLPVAGDPNFVKVLDFGIAKLEDTHPDKQTKLTEAGMIMGTPTYMSPEQARGEVLDTRSDIYALGVMMYEALVGEPPFVGDSPMTVLIKHIKDPPKPPTGVRPDLEIPRSIEVAVLKCLEKAPDDRFQSASDLATALRRAMETTGTLAGIAQDEAEKLATMAMGGALLGLDDADVATQIVDAAPAQEGAQARGARPAPAPAMAATPPRSSQAPVWIGLGAFALIGLIAVVVAMADAAHDDPARPAAVRTAGSAPGVAAGADPGTAGSTDPAAGTAGSGDQPAEMRAVVDAGPTDDAAKAAAEGDVAPAKTSVDGAETRDLGEATETDVPQVAPKAAEAEPRAGAAARPSPTARPERHGVPATTASSPDAGATPEDAGAIKRPEARPPTTRPKPKPDPDDFRIP